MSVIQNNAERASHHASQLKSAGTMTFEPVVSIDYSSSGAVSGLNQSLTLATEVVQLFAAMAKTEGENIQALSTYWQEKDQAIARSGQ